MKHRWIIHTVSILLAFAMLVQTVPASAVTTAEITDPSTGIAADDATVTSDNDVTVEEAAELPAIVGEEESLRSENEKHFRLEDGSYIAVAYDSPVHYQDASGDWQEIDNSLSVVEDSKGHKAYRSKNAITPAVFSADLEEGKLLSSSVADVSVSMHLLDSTQLQQLTVSNRSAADTFSAQQVSAAPKINYNRDVKACVPESSATAFALENTADANKAYLQPENLETSVFYPEVYPDVDLLYTAYGYTIKEQIIVNTPQSSYRYDFLLKLEGLTAILNDDGSVSLLDADGAEAYYIPAPYMEDAAGVTSTDVTYALTQTAEGVVLTVEADAVFMNASERQYPVAIDPTLVASAKKASADVNQAMYATYVVQGAPTTIHGEYQTLYLGYGQSTAVKAQYAYMHFKTMPTIPSGSIVTSAELQMNMIDYSYVTYDEMPISVYEVTEAPSNDDYYSWICNLNWNGRPSFDTTNEIDYATVSAADTDAYVSWEITELVKKWYAEGTKNRTVALKASAGRTYDTTHCAVAAFKAYGGVGPSLIVRYRSNVGLESYYTYNSASVGNAGVTYIADESGQLKVATPLVGYSSTTNPVSINLFYNSDYFTSSATTPYKPPMESGLDMTVGHGWTLDIIQKMQDCTISGVSYKKYTDGDGTVHYFLQKTAGDTYFYDEDGLGLKVTETSSNNYTMSDDHGNVWKFTNNYLTEMTDSDGNKILINYTDGQIATVMQKNNDYGTITVATFEYSDAAGALTKVTDAAGNIYTLTYSDELGNLTAIKRNGTTIARFRYNGRRVIRAVDTESSYAIAFDYTNGKISSYQEVIGVDSDDTTGAKVAVTYPNHSKTVYRDYGADRIANTSDDILTHYLFDYAGRTVNAYTTNNEGSILGASNAVYTGSGTTSKKNNRTLRSASIGTAAQQLLKNTGVESTDSYLWTLTDTVVSTATPRTGLRSIKGTLGSGVQSAKRVTEVLTAGKTYTFSAYVNTSKVTAFSGEGVFLKVTDNTTDETWKSVPISHKTSADIDEGWVRISVSFTAQTSDTHVIGVYCDGGSGSFYADDFQVERGASPSEYNMLQNGGMEMSITYGWTLGSSASHYTTLGVSGSEKSLKIVSAPLDTTTPRAHQDVTVNLPATETYVLSGWVLANAVPDTVQTADNAAEDKNKQCGLRAAVYYTDGDQDTFYVPFNSDLSGWQFVSYTIVPTKSAKTVERIRVICAYESNANRAYFDNIALVREAAQTMKYDDDGNLESVTTTGLDKDVNTYEGGNLIEKVTGGYGTYTYNYTSDTNEHRVTSVVGHYLSQTFGHVDAQGNLLSTTLKSTNSEYTDTLKSSATYSGSGNLMTSMTDSNGITTTYTYGSANNYVVYGIPSAVTDANGTKVNQTIDAGSRITDVSIANTASLQYTYAEGNLTGITRTDTASGEEMKYAFTYDAFGNMTKAKAGSRTLATYSYAEKNGLLSEIEYGNGAVTKYTYDTLGRLKTTLFNNSQQLTYTYDGNGNISRVKENGGSAVLLYYYTYDTLGRLISSRMQKGVNAVLQTGQEYDANNRLTKQSWWIDGGAGAKSYSEEYTYNSYDGQLRTVTTATGEELNINYDSLRRLKSVSGGKYTKQYTYRDISDTRSTNQIQTLSYPDLAVPLTYSYTYDDVGNIETISDPIDGEKSYAYDGQGQMLSETIGDTKYTYTYDGVGNITKANNSTGSHTYSYKHGSWGDLLTSYDGQAITYDDVGNPLSYYNGTAWEFTWTNGRQLSTATAGSTAVSYKYDMVSGMRLSKKVGSTTYQYYYAGDKLMRMTVSDGTVMDFFYDHLGQPYAVDYNGTKYYYILNQQGDVVRLVSKTGTSYGVYRYDAWGNILYSTNAALIRYNPLRYRGYVYDNETNMYYCQSRYYDPAIGRFINADGYVSTGQGVLGTNMFAYCGNNPVNHADPSGQLWGIVIGVTLVVGLVASLSGCSAKPAATTSTSSAPSTPSVSSSTSSASRGNYNDYLKALRQREASGNYAAVSSFGYLGAYQMGTSALQDAGFKNSSGAWTDLAKSYGVNSSNDFLNTPKAQDAAVTAYNKKVSGYIKHFGLDSYIGTSYCGVKVTKSGLLASCHLVGVGAMRNALTTGSIVWDGNGVHASEYLNLLGGYDVSEVWQ